MKLGRYTVVRRLGAGGMAELFLARVEGPAGFDKQVVLKRILPICALDPTHVRLFCNEARLAARLSHPNIVQLYGFERIDGQLYISMEYVPGPSCRAILTAELARGLLLPVELACTIVAQACEGLHYAHALREPESGAPAGIVHRDLSPDNLIVGPEGCVKICDFGIARSLVDPARTIATRGKTSYLAPERLDADRPIDHRSDVFALGVVLFELLLGERPFSGGDELQIMNAIAHARPPRISSLRPDVPGALDDVFERALAKRPEDRFQSCLELADALEALGLVTKLRRAPELMDVVRRAVTPADDSAPADTALDVPLVAVPPEAQRLTQRLPAAPPRPKRRRSSVIAALVVAAIASSASWRCARDREEGEAAMTARAPLRAARARSSSALGAARRQAPGHLEVRVYPFAWVRLDGAELGPTPLPRLTVSPGEHVLELFGPNREPAATRRVTVSPGEVQQLRLRID